MINLKKIILESIRGEYEKHGVQGYYEKFGNQYQNPHEKTLQDAFNWLVQNWGLDLSSVLDMSAGGGEMTKVLLSNGYTNIEGSDPHTCSLYTKSTGKHCSKLSFDDILHGGLNRDYSTIICSYALHLCDKSKLPNVIWQLAQNCDNFLVLGPTKNPEIKEEWGMKLNNSTSIEGVKIRWYKPDIY